MVMTVSYSAHKNSQFHMKFETFVPNIDELIIGHIVYKSC